MGRYVLSATLGWFHIDDDGNMAPVDKPPPAPPSSGLCTNCLSESLEGDPYRTSGVIPTEPVETSDPFACDIGGQCPAPIAHVMAQNIVRLRRAHCRTSRAFIAALTAAVLLAFSFGVSLFIHLANHHFWR